MASKIRFKIQKALGRDRQAWPVTVYKIEQRGNGLNFTTDRGRRIQNPETGEREYEFLKENDATIPIERKYIQTGPGNHPLLLIAKVTGEDRDSYIPIHPEINVQLPEEMGGEKLQGSAGMSFLVQHSEYVKVAKNELERHYEITKNEKQAWYQDSTIQAAILFFGAGMFFFLAAMGYSKMITQPFIEASRSFPNPSITLPLMLTQIRRIKHK